MIYSWKKIVKHGLPLLTLCVLVEVFAGQILQNNQDALIGLPIFLICIPVINSVGGNIGSVLGARLASGLHVGYVGISFRDGEMHENLLCSVLVGVFTYFFLSLIIYFVYSVFFVNRGSDLDLSIFSFIYVVLGAGILLIIVVCLVSVFTAFLSFKKGLDPDDMIAPVVTTIGDVMGILFLFLFIRLAGFI